MRQLRRPAMSGPDGALEPARPGDGDSRADQGVLRPSLAVHRVEPGSVLVLTGAAFGSADFAQHLLDEIESAVGHRQFALLCLSAGASEVWGPDVDLRAKVLELLPPPAPANTKPPAVTVPDRVHPGPVTTSSDELRGRAAGGPR